MEKLPFEVAKKIFEYLEPNQRIQCESVCKRWFEIIKSTWTRFAFSFPEEFYYHGHLRISSLDSESSQKFKTVGCKCQIHKAFEYFGSRTGSSIKFVSVVSNTTVESSSMDILVSQCPNVKDIRFESCIFGSAVSPLALLYSASHLEQLVLKNVHVAFPTNFEGQSAVAPIKHLTLANVQTSGEDLSMVFQSVGPTLESLYVDAFLWASNEQLFSSFHFMQNLSNLCLHDAVITDENLPVVANDLPNLECLSVHENGQITSIGVNNLLKTVVGKSKLRFLNLCHCFGVDSGILDSLNVRPQTSPMLTIFAYNTGIESSSSSESGTWKVVKNEQPGPGLFYGFEPSPDVDEEDDDSDFSGGGFDPDIHDIMDFEFFSEDDGDGEYDDAYDEYDY